jgi:hypothetical protein
MRFYGENMLRKFRRNRRGTAEVIGSVLFIIIIIFFFSNVYLWHDSATKQMNSALSDKMNSPISVVATAGGLAVTNEGGVDAVLSRLWITDGSQHVFAEFENVAPAGAKILVQAGQTRQLELITNDPNQNPGSDPKVNWDDTAQPVAILYTPLQPSSNFICKVLTANGNTASCEYFSGNVGLGSAVAADSGSFEYYAVTVGGGNIYTFDSLSGSPNYIVNSGTKVFSVTLTNSDPSRREILLEAHSQLFFLNATNPSNSFPVYIISTSGDGSTKTILSTYSQITLPYKVPITVYFASDNPTQFAPKNIEPQGIKTFTLNLALFGTIGGSPTFGQNIPLNSIIIS